MKRMLLVLTFLPLMEITTGDATAKSVVRTEVSGNASVETRVTTTVNGQTTVVESSAPGVLNVQNIDGTVSVQKKEGSSAAILEEPKPKKTTFQELLRSLWTRIRSLLGIRS